MTLGSMTDATTIGSNERPPGKSGAEGGAWRLWRNLASRQAGFGNPEAFCQAEDRPAGCPSPRRYTVGSSWILWNVLPVTSPGRVDWSRLRQLWLASVGCHLLTNPISAITADAFVFWGYGLRSDRPGDFVRKPMREWSGEEIATELSGQLGLGQAERLAASTTQRSSVPDASHHQSVHAEAVRRPPPCPSRGRRELCDHRPVL